MVSLIRTLRLFPLTVPVAATAPSRPATEIAGTRQIALYEQGHDCDRIVFRFQNADTFIRRERLLDLAAPVQDAENPDALVAARGVA